MNQNPFTTPVATGSARTLRKSSKRAYVVASMIAASLFFVSLLSLWVTLDAEVVEGQVVVSDPTVRSFEDPLGNRYSTYDSFFMFEIDELLILLVVLLAVLLLSTNGMVWLVHFIFRIEKAVPAERGET